MNPEDENESGVADGHCWKTLSRRSVLDCGKFLQVESHHVLLPDGHEIPDWGWVVTPDFANVVAECEDGTFLCFRQTKYALEGTSLAVVGGYIEDGEDPETAARRELLEEGGLEAPEWISLGSYVVDANRGAGHAHFFLARGARQVAEPASDDLEHQEILMLTRAELEAALKKGLFQVLPWSCCVSLALAHIAGDSHEA